MDYDRTDIPSAYDRGRDHGPALLDLWMKTVAAHLNGYTPKRILDLGCGTGRFSYSLASYFDAELIGIDPSFKMLIQAHEKRSEGQNTYFQIARGEEMPLASQSIDLIFMSMSFHHLSDRRRAARECRRVLRAGGSVFVRTGSREQVPTYPYYAFIPATHPILLEVLPDSADVRDPFEAAGFQLRAHDLIEQTIAPSWEVYADKLETGSDSVLARLDRRDVESGIAAVRAHGARVGTQDIVEQIDLFVFT